MTPIEEREGTEDRRAGQFPRTRDTTESRSLVISVDQLGVPSVLGRYTEISRHTTVTQPDDSNIEWYRVSTGCWRNSESEIYVRLQ